MRRAAITGRVCAAALVIVAAMSVVDAKVKVRVQRDEKFVFRGLSTWAWHPSGAGDLKMALTPDDNPAAMRERVDPVIMDAIGRTLPSRGLTAAAAGATPDLYVNYYVLISTSMAAQTMGQFAPTVPEWGLPPFSGATQSLRVFEQGSLLIDVTSVPSKSIVWRGVAQAELHRDRTPAQREANLRAAIADVLKKLPKTT